MQWQAFLILKERRFASPVVFCRTNLNNPAVTLNGNTAAMFFALLHHDRLEISPERLAKKSVERI